MVFTERRVPARGFERRDSSGVRSLPGAPTDGGQDDLCSKGLTLTLVSEAHRFQVRTWPDRTRVIVACKGELDVSTVGAVRAAPDQLRTSGWRAVVLDVRDLTFIDSSGLSVLLEADRIAHEDGTAFAIVDGSPAVARLLELVGLSDHFARTQVS